MMIVSNDSKTGDATVTRKKCWGGFASCWHFETAGKRMYWRRFRLSALFIGLLLLSWGATSFQVRPAAAAPGSIATQSSGPKQAGVKGLAVKKAVKLLAKGIREGGNVTHKLIGYLDDKASRVFRKHSARIADGLDAAASIPDVTIKIVREKIFNFMVNKLGIGSGSALMIADAIDAVLWLLL